MPTLRSGRRPRFLSPSTERAPGRGPGRGPSALSGGMSLGLVCREQGLEDPSSARESLGGRGPTWHSQSQRAFGGTGLLMGPPEGHRKSSAASASHLPGRTLLPIERGARGGGEADLYPGGCFAYLRGVRLQAGVLGQLEAQGRRALSSASHPSGDKVALAKSLFSEHTKPTTPCHVVCIHSTETRGHRASPSCSSVPSRKGSVRLRSACPSGEEASGPRPGQRPGPSEG